MAKSAAEAAAAAAEAASREPAARSAEADLPRWSVRTGLASARRSNDITFIRSAAYAAQRPEVPCRSTSGPTSCSCCRPWSARRTLGPGPVGLPAPRRALQSGRRLQRARA
eukprot:800695-Alexandrium_andersonii.AAC.1